MADENETPELPVELQPVIKQMQDDKEAADDLMDEISLIFAVPLTEKEENDLKRSESENTYAPTLQESYTGYTIPEVDEGGYPYDDSNQAVAGFMGRGPLSNKMAGEIAKRIANGSFSAEVIDPSHVATIITSDPIKANPPLSLSNEDLNVLTDKYIEYFSNNNDNISGEEFQAVINSPIGDRVMSPEKTENLSDGNLQALANKYVEYFGNNSASISDEELQTMVTSPIGGKILTAENTKSLSPENLQILADKYAEYYNANRDNISNEELVTMLNSPIGGYMMSGDPKIDLRIEKAEDIINQVNLANLREGETAETFKAYALDNTMPALQSQIEAAPPQERADLEAQARGLAYKYTQNMDVLGKMEQSALLGRYALDEVLDHQPDVYTEDRSRQDRTVVCNVLSAALYNQDSKAHVGNYERLCLKYRELMPEAGEQYIAGEANYKQYMKGNNGQLRSLLGQSLGGANNFIVKGTLLDREGTVLRNSDRLYMKASALQHYEDFSQAYSFAHGDPDFKPEEMDGRKYQSWEYYSKERRTQKELNFTQRHKDFATYISCRERGDLEAQKAIEKIYGKEHLDNMYNYIHGMHEQYRTDATKAERDAARTQAQLAIEKIKREENLDLPSPTTRDGYALRVSELRSQLSLASAKYFDLNNEWNAAVHIVGQGPEVLPEIAEEDQKTEERPKRPLKAPTKHQYETIDGNGNLYNAASNMNAYYSGR